MSTGSFVHALIGAVVTTVLSAVPFSPVLGGGVAAYLSDADATDGVRIGAVSGVVASVPVLGLVLGVLLVVGVLTVGGPGVGVAFGIGGLGFGFVVGTVAVVYTVGLSALGGYLGSYPVDGTSERE
ncbi:DUF5518 domain-containing protein [Haloplanus sp.]|uniref:DUF5518 domain-containing protein n=1 Tax=Haloplanus sp. TaxID=1961696 RepID=UPI00260F54AD|nr:DUF5518 domain-containing protein [Haloplanus sp.]